MPALALLAIVAGNAWLALGALSGTAWNPLQSLLLFAALAAFALTLRLCRGAREGPVSVGERPLSGLSAGVL